MRVVFLLILISCSGCANIKARFVDPPKVVCVYLGKGSTHCFQKGREFPSRIQVGDIVMSPYTYGELKKQWQER